MSESAYYLGACRIPLEEEEEKARLIQRLRQYLELRNLTLLIGNGCSLPLGSPRINSVGSLIPEIDTLLYRLTDEERHSRARALLNRLLPKDSALGVEPLLTILANIQANEQLLHKAAAIEGAEISAADAQCLEQLLKKWLFHKCKTLSTTSDETFDTTRSFFGASSCAAPRCLAPKSSRSTTISC